MILKSISLLEEHIGYCFKNHSLLIEALTHPSYSFENGNNPFDYQRLEFLGDAMLGLCVANLLYKKFPLGDEGTLSRYRAALVSETSLAPIARTLELGQFILLGHGEKQSGGCNKDSILADVLEALIAAVYLDGGYDEGFKFVDRIIAPHLLEPCDSARGSDYKSELQELLVARKLPPPLYRQIDEIGPPHDRIFSFEVFSGNDLIGHGEGRSKKLAQQSAASNALNCLFNK